MSRILHRSIGRRYPVAETGAGITITDADGRRYLDASGGAAVSCLGHGHPDVLAAMHRQLDRLAYTHTSFFTTEAAEELADDLLAHAPEGMSHAFFVSGGSEAVEAALKLARQHCLEIGQPGRTRFIARRQSYHGNTLGALSVGGNALRRAPFAPLLFEAHHVSPCFRYRGMLPGETAETYATRLAVELEDKIAELGPETVIAFVAETVGGATAGAITPEADYFRQVRAICDRHGILLILDEVMCGMGRTGTLHACEQEGIAPDLMTVAKGLGGGFAPIGALLVGERIVRSLQAGSGAFQHGHTYVGHPLACAAALAVQGVIRRDDLLANVRRQGEHLAGRLCERFAQDPHVGDIRGRGLLWALEFVSDRDTKAPFAPGLRFHARLKQHAMDRGLMVYSMGGTVDGAEGDHVLLAPPFIVEGATVDAIVDRLGDAVAATTAEIGQAVDSDPAPAR